MAEADQTVVTESDGQAKPGTEATDARKPDDLDTLLAEFEKTASSSPASKPETKPETAQVAPDVAKRLEALERERADDRVQRDLAPVIAKIKEGLPAPDLLDDQEIIDLLDGRAKRDPRLAAAWANRHTNPKAWDGVVTALSRELSGKFKKLPDKAATEDRDAVAAAVRGASTTTPPPAKAPDYSKMGNAEYAAQVEKEHGFRPF